MTATPRTLLFAPGSDRRKLERLVVSGAALAVADLEDAVAESEKEAAREVVRSVFGRRPDGARRAIRVNRLDTPHACRDVEVAVELAADAIVVPKARLGELEGLPAGGLPALIPIIETPAGLQESDRIASVSNVWAMLLGGVDLGRLLRTSPRADGQELLFARSKLVLDSAAAGIAAPIDVVQTNLDAIDVLDAEARLARSLGFGGKACIHPRQLDVVERIFAPSVEEIEWAREVAVAFKAAQREGRGALVVRNEMIDLPVYEHAVELLEEKEGV